MLILPPQVEQKAAVPSGAIAPVDLSFAEFLVSGGNFDLGAFEAIRLYAKTMPLFNAIDTRAEGFSTIPLKIWNNSTDQFETGHKILDLLDSPNSDQSGEEFLYEMSSYLDITGNAFLVASGRVERPPLEISNVGPQFITFGFGGKFGILHVPDWIQVTTQSGAETFKAEEIEGHIRFINGERNRELWHIRNFSPFRNAGNFWGMSRARPVWLEIQQYLAGNNNNLSQLKRGTRLSMAWVNNRGEELTEIQWDRLQSEANKYKGDTNAGGTPILDGMDVKTVSATNRDMEYSVLQDATLKRISLVYKIPLAMVVDKATTFNNLATSNMQLYDRSIIPHSTRQYSELTRFLMSRYEKSENLKIWFNTGDIEALIPRTLDNAGKKSKIGVNTDNEIRTDLGYESIGTDGDVIYKPTNVMPVGSDEFTSDNLDKPSATKSRFLEIMRKQALSLSEDELNKMAADRGLK